MGMRTSNIRMTTRVPKAKLLETLRANLAKHSGIVREAREGYLTRARQALEQRLNDLRSGRTISLQFNLNPPADYSEVYKSCIQMLEWNTEESVELEPDEFKQLVLDQWDWTRGFLTANMTYSHQAMVDMDGLSGGREGAGG